MKIGCLDIIILLEYVQGLLKENELKQVETHLSLCHACRKMTVSIYEIMNTEPLPECPPASRSEAEMILKKISSVDIIEKLVKVYQWIRTPFFASSDFAFSAIRNLCSSPDPEYVKFSEELSDIQTEIYICKTGKDTVDIAAGAQGSDLQPQSIRFTLMRDDGAVISRPLSGSQIVFENMPFGTYRLLVKQHGIQKGVCIIRIDETQITVCHDCD